jgi:hypothetical protein
LSVDDAARLEMPAYYTCQMELRNGGVATIMAPQVPKAWQQMQFAGVSQPASAAGLFLKRVSNTDGETLPLFVAKRIAWHPTAVDEPHVSFGQSVLGTLGMDVGLLDDIRTRGPIRAEEREAFYRLLDAVGRIGANQLIRFASGNLVNIRNRWQRELEVGQDDARRALAQEVVRRAKLELYSVAPLFNDPERHIGELVVLEGVARRVVRVDVATRPNADGPSDVARRFGIKHYYEMEVFTDDSQNYPVVFCVRELPAGFPIEDKLHVPVRVAGFFFKDWLYTTRGEASQYAPLLVGRGAVVLDVQQGGTQWPRAVAGGLFLLALAGVWAAAWWFARSDRKFAARTPAAGFSLPKGQSLNELNVVATNQPMNNPWETDSSTATRAE